MLFAGNMAEPARWTLPLPPAAWTRIVLSDVGWSTATRPAGRSPAGASSWKTSADGLT